MQPAAAFHLGARLMPDADDRLAAVDLGSNSFRLEIARYADGDFQRLEFMKEAVRQGAELDRNWHLSDAAMQRGWECLARFAPLLAGIPKERMRAVATQTMREARNRSDFITRAEEVLGCPIEIIGGHEEARLIYLGVTQHLPPAEERRLVMDIGGRSTELILGSGQSPQRTATHAMGAVSWSMQHFADGRINAARFDAAEDAALALLQSSGCVRWRNAWEQAWGCSGTVGAVADVLLATERAEKRYAITREGVQWLRAQLIAAGHVERIDIPGLKDSRKPVAAGGIAILCAILDALDIDALTYSPSAMRHGMLFDMLQKASN